jgi:chemotaxis protein MotA
MDITTLIGIVLALGAVVFGALSSGDYQIIALLALYDLPSLIIVLGGTIATTILSCTGSQLATIPKMYAQSFKGVKVDYMGTVTSIIDLANIARKEGLLALEEVANNIPNAFLKKAVNLMVDGTDPVLLKDIMESEISATENRHLGNTAVLDNMAAAAPAFGMLGTLIGLINMLGNLSDPDSLGPNMAVALITTFYGSLIANVLCTPIAVKLRTNSAKEIMEMEIMLEGIMSIHGGENPHIIEEKLLSFLSASEKAPKKGGAAETQPAE